MVNDRLDSGTSSEDPSPGAADVTIQTDALMKLAQGGRHFQELDDRIQAWNRAHRPLLPARFSGPGLRVLDVFHPSTPLLPPLKEWSAAFSDALSNLRSSLEVLAYDLCHLDGRSPARPKQVAFPIATNSEDWGRKTRNLSSMPAHLLSRIEELQPYHLANPASHALAVLHDLEATSKHRALVNLWPLPAGNPLEGLRAWPEGLPTAGSFDLPWMRFELDRGPNPDPGSLVWEAELVPVVAIGSQLVVLSQLASWIFQETNNAIAYVARGQDATLSTTVSPPRWIDLGQEIGRGEPWRI
jgi:hypothetical protein